MMASLVRAARATGEAELFGANGPALWTRVRRHLESLLTAYWQEGGLGGTLAGRSVRGALRPEHDDARPTSTRAASSRRSRFCRSAAIERITVVLALSAAGQIVGEVREVA